MRLVVRKLEIPDLGQLQSLVIEHLDGIEPGLTVLDSRLLLGHATVDIVALDTEGALVLVTAGFTADEDMLLKAVEAYSWCLEYPDAIRRLYPSVEVSSTRPPRLMFIVERLPDAFHRKIKQLGFSEVDCVEFRHLDVSGTPAVYFDTLARLRRGSTHAEFQPAPIARRVSEPQIRRTSEPAVAEQSLDKTVDHSDKVVPLVTSSARTTSVRLQKMLNTNGHAHRNGGAPVIDIVTRAAPSLPRTERPTPSADIAAPSAGAVRIEEQARPVETPRIEVPTLEIPLPQIETETAQEEPLELAQDVIAAAHADEAPSLEVAAPVAEAAAPEVSSSATEPEPQAAPQTPEPRISFAEIANELLGALGAASTTPAAAAAASIPTDVLEDKRGESKAEVNAAAVVEEQPAAAPARKPVFTAPKPVAAATKPVAPVIKAVAPATKTVAPTPKPIAPAPKPVPAAKAAAATSKPAAAASKPAAAEAAPAASEASSQALPQEFEGLKFPNDGVLTRQWMEFLNQMASGK